MSKGEAFDAQEHRSVAAEVLPALHSWAGLFVMLAGTLLSPLDFFIVNTGLPSIRADLGADAASVQLVLSGYAGAYAVLLITGGRLGDLYGRRRIFLIGMVGFALASLGCGLAPSPRALVLGRIVQGGFAAILMPQSLATIRATFPADQRAKALGLYAATFGVAAVLGQLLGGVLISIDVFGMGWRSIFLVNVPVAAIVVVLTLRLVSETRDARTAARPDIAGLLLLGAGLAAIVVPLSEGRDKGWPLWTIVLLAASIPILLFFWRYEERLEARGADALCPPSALTAPGLPRALAATLLYYAGGGPYFLLLALYEQVGLRHTPLQAGLAVLPFGLAFALTSFLSGRVLQLVGRQAPAIAVALFATAMVGTAVAAALGQGWAVVPLGLVAGIAQGFGLPALVRTIIERMDARWAGLGAGLMNSTLQIGAALGITVFAGLYYALLAGRSQADAVVTAFAWALTGMGLTQLAAAWLIGGVCAYEPTDRAPVAPRS